MLGKTGLCACFWTGLYQWITSCLLPGIWLWYTPADSCHFISRVTVLPANSSQNHPGPQEFYFSFSRIKQKANHEAMCVMTNCLHNSETHKTWAQLYLISQGQLRHCVFPTCSALLHTLAGTLRNKVLWKALQNIINIQNGMYKKHSAWYCKNLGYSWFKWDAITSTTWEWGRICSYEELVRATIDGINIYQTKLSHKLNLCL